MENNTPKKEVTRLIIALLVLFLIGGGFLLYLSIPLLSQTSVILSTQPVDPFDPIRGQFMIVRYEINSVPTLENSNPGDTVYISLEEDENGISRYAGASLKKPDGIFIKGEINSVSSTNMRVSYGIEQYFFERGAKFETRINNIEVKLAGNGRPVIVAILDMNKEPVIITYKNKTLTT